jgi:hypothetical protein
MLKLQIRRVFICIIEREKTNKQRTLAVDYRPYCFVEQFTQIELRNEEERRKSKIELY